MLRPGRPAGRQQPIAAWQDTEFARAAWHLRGSTFVAHVRYASTGARTLANTHPFLQDGRLFAHNGVVQGLDRLDRSTPFPPQPRQLLGLADLDPAAAASQHEQPGRR